MRQERGEEEVTFGAEQGDSWLLMQSGRRERVMSALSKEHSGRTRREDHVKNSIWLHWFRIQHVMSMDFVSLAFEQSLSVPYPSPLRHAATRVVLLRYARAFLPEILKRLPTSNNFDLGRP